MGGAPDHGRRHRGLRAPLAVARNRRGAADGAPEFALLAGEIRARARHRRRRAHLHRHGRHGGRVVSRRSDGHGGGKRGVGPPWPGGAVCVPCRICRARPRGELHRSCEGGAEPRASRREPDTLHRPRLPHGRTLRRTQRRHLHALRLLVGRGDAPDGASRLRQVESRAQLERHRHRGAPLRRCRWHCHRTGHRRLCRQASLPSRRDAFDRLDRLGAFCRSLLRSAFADGVRRGAGAFGV